MTEHTLSPGQHIHIIGIGGFGMSAIARVLLARGYTVSGSDLRRNALTDALAETGAQVVQGHAAENIAGADVVIATSAAGEDNPEIVAARAAGVPVLRRREALGALLADKIGVAIAGTHGKTTTSALAVHVLRAADLSPSYIVGGVLCGTGTNAGVGHGPHFVIEADEYDRMFLGLSPRYAILTTIEHDHPDCFPTFDDVRAAFAEFVARIPADGLLIACADDPTVRTLAKEREATGGAVVYYGLGEDLPAETWRADEIAAEADGMHFYVWRGERSVGGIRLTLHGRHNVANALGVMALADALGISFERTRTALAHFAGTQRRAELLGQATGVSVISDYAHHPTAIRVTLQAFRQRPDVRELWAVWQPHTYGRMRALADEFAGAFAAADHALVTDVYSVREQPSEGLDAPQIAERIAQSGHPDARYSGDLEATARLLAAEVRSGDAVLILSAGDAPRVGALLLKALRQREQPSDA